jgi:DNA-binding transcriptional LysR family regulator
MDRLAAMEVFVRVVDSGSFSGATRQQRIGQPAASKTIAQLEDRLGVRLLLRSTHGLMTTEAGRNFYNRAKRSIEEAEEAEMAARGAAATLSGRLHFSAPLTFACLHIMPRLPAFLAEHPSLDIDACLGDHYIDLAAGLDVAVLPSRLAQVPGRWGNVTFHADRLCANGVAPPGRRSAPVPIVVGEPTARAVQHDFGFGGRGSLGGASTRASEQAHDGERALELGLHAGALRCFIKLYGRPLLPARQAWL